MKEAKIYMDKTIEIEQLNETDILYHYSTAQGVKGIIDNNKLWVSKHDFLNDPTEYDYIKRVLEKVISESIHDIGKRDRFNRLFEREVLRFNEGDDFEHGDYIASFSLRKDSLALWSEFSGGTGYNIGFRGKEILDILYKENGIIHGKVVYDIDLQCELLRKLIFESIPAEFNKSFDEIIDLPDEDKELDEYLILTGLGYGIYRMFFKASSFSDEDEYRIIFLGLHNKKITPKNWKCNPRLFREKEGFLIPYIEVDIVGNGDKLSIDSITIGPKNNIDLAIKGMDLYMKNMGYNIEIRKSQIPLRY